MIVVAEFLLVTQTTVALSLTACAAPKTTMVVVRSIGISLDVLFSLVIFGCHWVNLGRSSSHHVVLSNVEFTSTFILLVRILAFSTLFLVSVTVPFADLATSC